MGTIEYTRKQIVKYECSESQCAVLNTSIEHAVFQPVRSPVCTAEDPSNHLRMLGSRYEGSESQCMVSNSARLLSMLFSAGEVPGVHSRKSE